jgi:hypothetical protein
MAKDFEIIRARTKDDAVVLIDRLMRTKQDDIVLALPKNSIISADLISLKTLQEEAESVGKNLFLDTENEELSDYAKKINMPIYNIDVKTKPEEVKINLVRHSGGSRKIMDIQPPRRSEIKPKEIEEQPMVYNEPEELQPETNFIPMENPVVYEVVKKTLPSELGNHDLDRNLEDFYSSKSEQTSHGISGIGKFFTYKVLMNSFIVLGGLLLASSLFLILPKVNIKIAVKEMPIKTDIPVAVSKSVGLANLSGGIIPGQYFIFSKSETKPLTKESVVTTNANVKYGGYISIFNAYSVAPQKLVTQTRFENKDGKIFRITNAVTVPGAKMENGTLTPSSIKVKVISDAVGEEYNIGPAYFTIPGFKGSPKYAGFYAKSTESMVGEAVPATGAGISKEEQNALKIEMQNELIKQIESDALGSLKDGDFKLIDGASGSKVDEFRIDANSAFMKLTWQAILFKESDFKALVNYSVLSHYSELKNFDFQDNIMYPRVTSADFKKGEIFFTYNVDKVNAYAVNLDDLKKELVGRNEDEIRSIISGKNFVNSATISFPMFWFKNASNNPEKINITIDK